MRKPLIAGNWKMYKTAGEAVILVQALADALYQFRWDDREVAVCPPFTALKSVSTVIELDKLEIALGAQDCFWEDEGAFTGQVACPMLKDLACKYVIVGHSERRQFFGETDDTVSKKAHAVRRNSMVPIVCVGETADEEAAGKTQEVIQRQVLAGLAGLDIADGDGLVVAYEPVWAIGTGRTPTPEGANDTIRHIRAVMTTMFQASAQKVRILYGGSVKPENMALFMEEPEIDGALVGGAALKADSFASICDY
jgi:triosephosphate isomerase (TIM)